MNRWWTCSLPLLVFAPWAIAAALSLTACGHVAPTLRRDPLPAQIEEARLRAIAPPAAAEVATLRADELAAGKSAATAFANGDSAEAARQSTLAQKLGEIRRKAEQRETDQRQQLATLADDAHRRALAEGDELDQRTRAIEDRARVDDAVRQTNADRRWAVIGLALCAAAGVALRALGLPVLVSLGIPGAVATGCLVLIAWTSVPWLAAALGWALAVAVLAVLVILIRTVLREWLRYAEHLNIAMPDAKTAVDNASRAMQPPWIRWLLDHLLRAVAA